MSIFRMPSLGADMESGKLVEWLVAPGDKVARGDVVAVVETQKGAIEIEIFDSGVVAELLAQPGETLPVGAPLARLMDAGETIAVMPPGPKSVPEPEVAPSFADSAQQPVGTLPAIPREPTSPELVTLASPGARARAAAAGLALAEVAGSGPGGAVLIGDVERHLKAALTKPALPDAPVLPKPCIDMTAMRRAISTAMSRSKREIPHYYLCHEIDLQTAQIWLEAENTARAPDKRLLMTALLIRAAVRALARVPELNGRFEGDPFAPSSSVHCGMAIALRGGGLIAPAILDAGDKDVDSLMNSMRDLVARTRAGRLRNSEVTQGTITVSSLGEKGVDALFGVIYPPQVALIGFGAPRLKPMVHDNVVEPGVALTASLAGDHRVSDGRRGAVYLTEIDRLLQEPEKL